MTNKKSKLFTV